MSLIFYAFTHNADQSNVLIYERNLSRFGKFRSLTALIVTYIINQGEKKWYLQI